MRSHRRNRVDSHLASVSFLVLARLSDYDNSDTIRNSSIYPLYQINIPLAFIYFFVYTTCGMKNDKAFDHHAIAPPQKVQTVDSI